MQIAAAPRKQPTPGMVFKSTLKIKLLIIAVSVVSVIVALNGLESFWDSLGCSTNKKGGGLDKDTSASSSKFLRSSDLFGVTRKAVADEENLVLNPSFEDGTTSKWKTVGQATLGIVTAPSSDGHGYLCASVTGDTEEWPGISQRIGPRLIEGIRYKVSALVQLVDTKNHQKIKISFTGDGQPEPDMIIANEVVEPGNEWTEIQGYYIASGDKNTNMYLRAPKGVKLLVNFVSVEEADCDFNHFVRDFDPESLEINCKNWDELEMGEVLGQGRSRQVLEATWKGTKVAVKQPLHTERLKARRSEVLRVAAINNQLTESSNIIKIIGMCDSSLVFEYTPTPLKSIVFDNEHNKLSVKKSLSIGLDIVKGLAQLHSIGPVVHGDLRISQYLIDPKGKVMLGDLESSRYVGPDKSGNKCTFWKKAGRGGTFNSPERLSEDADLDEKTDIYRVALTLWTVFTGEFPYQPVDDVKGHVLSGGRPSLDTLSGYPQTLKDLLADAWDHDPLKRPSAEDMVKRMRGIVKNYVPPKETVVAEKTLDDSKSVDRGDGGSSTPKKAIKSKQDVNNSKNQDSNGGSTPKKATRSKQQVNDVKSADSNGGSTPKKTTKSKQINDSESADTDWGEETDSGDVVSIPNVKINYQANCLDPKGPQPYIFLTRGRSGSGSTWQIIGNLTGYETPNDRPTGGTAVQSRKFFEGKDTDQWLQDILCSRQEQYPEAGIVGFKWKPFDEFFSAGGQAALQTIASLKKPRIKIVRNKRNLLDVIISSYKHKIYDSAVTAQHCHTGDADCAQRAKEASMGLKLPTKKLLDKLRRDQASEDKIDEMLVDMGVPHVQVAYEELYYGKGGGIYEWMKIFKFLGIGPGEGLTKAQLNGAMEHVATNIPMHNVTLGNYKEVKKVLKGTEFEDLLH